MSRSKRLTDVRSGSNLVIRRPLPVSPDKQTFSASIGMSQRCQYRKPAISVSAATRQLSGLLLSASFWKISRVFRRFPDKSGQIVAHAADRSTVIVEALGPINAKRCFFEGEAPSRHFWKLRFVCAHTFAVLRLMTKLNLVGCCTGISAGFSPPSMRPT